MGKSSVCPVSRWLACGLSCYHLVKTRSMVGQDGNPFPSVQTHLSHYILAMYLLMSEMLLLNWICCFCLQLWSLCGLIAKLMIYTLMLHLGPSCLSLMALGNTAAAMMTWPRGWQNLTCLFLPMTMVSSLKQYLIYSISGLYWSKCH